MTDAPRGDDGGGPHGLNSASLEGHIFVMGQHGDLVAEGLRRRKETTFVRGVAPDKNQKMVIRVKRADPKQYATPQVPVNPITWYRREDCATTPVERPQA
jgi:hypothetical protein